MANKKKRGAMPWYVLIGLILTGISIGESFGSIFTNLGLNNGIAMLASIVETVGLVAFFVLVMIHHSTPEITGMPVIAAIVAVGSGLIRIFSNSWSYLFFAAPIVLLVLFILQPDWNLWPICAGAALMVVNVIAGIIVFYSSTVVRVASFLTGGKLSSLYIASLLINHYSLFGIALILTFVVIPRRQRTGTDLSKQNYGGGTGGGMGNDPSMYGF
jgi:hypothetical protein